jgi:AmmeMemoRadiSam system protein B
MPSHNVRPAAVAGTFYPGNAAVLRHMLDEYLAAAAPPAAGAGPVRAVIAPHAGYVYSGPIAAFSFKALPPAAGLRRVFLLGPAHYVPVPGVALGGFDAFATPLGSVPVDVATVQAMLDERPGLYVRHNAAHTPEHSLEVELPFLQRTVGAVTIVPMLFGTLNERAIAAVAQDLAARLAPGDLVVVSSDLSHYYDYETARSLDRRFLQAVMAGDEGEAARGEACGIMAVLALMQLARQLGWTPELRDARSSGDTAGDRGRVVGYASVVYHERTPEPG